MYFYWQPTGGQEKWNTALASDRAQIIETHSPQFATVLDVSRDVADCTPEEVARLTYSGPFYVDFDGESIEEVTPRAIEFLVLFAQAGGKVEHAQLYATGGRGYHIEVPLACLVKKVPAKGFQDLPLIYREMAYTMRVDTLDMRVYSAKRGRMWRVPNVQRDNGLFKVPITFEELQEMTPQRYVEICSSPRGVPPSSSKSLFNPELAVHFLKAQDKVAAGAKGKAKRAGTNAALVKQFNGNLPPTVQHMMRGEKLSTSAGWNQIALQLAITANALGLNHDKFIDDCEQLIEQHRGNGNRYVTVEARRRELASQLAYTADNPTYGYSGEALASLLVPGEIAADLKGLTADSDSHDYVQTQVAVAEAESLDFTGGVLVGESGIRVRKTEGVVTLSTVGITDPVLNMELTEFGVKKVGYTLTLHYMGKSRAAVLPYSSLSGKQKLRDFLAGEVGGTFVGTDNHAAHLQEILNLQAASRKEVGMDILTKREGLDIVTIPGDMAVEEVAQEPFAMYASPTGCALPDRLKDTAITFRFRGAPNPKGVMQSDLLHAPNACDPKDIEQFLAALMRINYPVVIVPVLGWFAATHARMFYHQVGNRFPLLALAGEAGAGKTETARLMSKLHYYKAAAPNFQAIGSTLYGFTSAVMGSTSLPVWLDEYKPREMPAGRHGQLMSVFRAAYDNGVFTKGSEVSTGTAQREIVMSTFSAPIMFLAEAPEMQTAVQERTITVLLDKSISETRKVDLDRAIEYSHVLPILGKKLVSMLLQVTTESFKLDFQPAQDTTFKAMFQGSNYRPVYNWAVVLHGLQMLERVATSLGAQVSGLFDEAYSVITESIPNRASTIKTHTRAEYLLMLDQLALMATMHDLPDMCKLRVNQDFAYGQVKDGNRTVHTLELSLPTVYAKYEEFCKRGGREKFYDNYRSFVVAIAHARGVLNVPPQHFKGRGNVLVFDVEKLQELEVAPFL